MTRLRYFGYVLLGELATTRLVYSLHGTIYRLSGGRIFGRPLGCPVVLITTTGRTSGEPRTVPVFGFQDGQSIVVVPSNAGKQHYPSWYLNLSATPRARVQLGGEIRQVKAREATPSERERLWPYVASRYGGYTAYGRRTNRHIPIVILEQI